MKLRAGEAIRKDGRYQYRYREGNGRKTIYARSLQELRKKEDELKTRQAAQKSGKTVSDYVDLYMGNLRGLSDGSVLALKTKVRRIKGSWLGTAKIEGVRFSDARQYVADLVSEGLSRGTIIGLVSVLRRVFSLAVEDYCITSNPFSFSLRDVGLPKTEKQNALTETEAQSLLKFLQDDSIGQKHFDMVYVLLYSGLRVSEFCGLRVDDLDFKNKIIHVDHQVVKGRGGVMYVRRCKTDAGNRFIPMTKGVEATLKRMIDNRNIPMPEPVLYDAEGSSYTNFLTFDRKGAVCVAHEVDAIFRTIKKRYNETHDHEIKQLHPHTCRHTFCTWLIGEGLSVKGVQYVAGHASASTTLNIYADTREKKVLQEFRDCVVGC